MNRLQALKITLLIVILAEEIKRACNKNAVEVINLDPIRLNHHLHETFERVL